MGFRQKARGKRQKAKGKGEEKQVYLTSLGNAIVAIDLCVLCVWSGSFHSFTRKSTRIWRC
ncbi:hypothetical protein [Microcystis sp.]|uniref:hypothetical protein n=1 Tax=Microcystis sp. TaxID=1127 RepID=UPI00391B8D07